MELEDKVCQVSTVGIRLDAIGHLISDTIKTKVIVYGN